MKIIIGLGNPGDKYKQTRHNAGFMAVDALAKKLNLTWEKKKKFGAEIADGQNIILVKPQDFMNDSGRAAAAVLSYYNLLPKKLGFIKTGSADLSEILTVVHDDLDIELGKYKSSTDSRSAGHRGVQSIIDNIKTQKIRRLRIGIKTDDLKNIPAEKFVLQKFNEEEMKIINNIIFDIIKSIEDTNIKKQ